MTRRGKGTRDPGRSERAQTVQDFAVGASVFLLTVAFVFAFVPSLFTPFESSVDPGASMQVDRVSDQILNDTQIAERPNYLRETGGSYSLSALFSESPDDLQVRYQIPNTSQINVTLRPLESGTDPVAVSGAPATAGQTYFGRPAASITRVVVVPGHDPCDANLAPDNGGPDSSQGCRLIIRIW